MLWRTLCPRMPVMLCLTSNEANTNAPLVRAANRDSGMSCCRRSVCVALFRCSGVASNLLYCTACALAGREHGQGAGPEAVEPAEPRGQGGLREGGVGHAYPRPPQHRTGRSAHSSCLLSVTLVCTGGGDFVAVVEMSCTGLWILTYIDGADQNQAHQVIVVAVPHGISQHHNICTFCRVPTRPSRTCRRHASQDLKDEKPPSLNFIHTHLHRRQAQYSRRRQTG